MSRLNTVINDNHKLQGIHCGDTEKKCCMAADDTVISLHGNQDNLSELEMVLKAFYSVSGLKVNFHKSKIMKIGSWKNKSIQLDTTENYVWTKPDETVRYLGIDVSASPDSLARKDIFNFSHMDIRMALYGLRYQKVSIIGRILLIKSLVASKLVYKLLHFPLPNNAIFKKINNLFYEYVWDYGRHKLNVRVMEQPLNKGGFNMLNIGTHAKALQYNWLNKAMMGNIGSLWVKQLESALCISLKDFLHCNLFSIKSVRKLYKPDKKFPCFWEKLFDKWFRDTYVKLDTEWAEGMKVKGVIGNTALGMHSKYIEWVQDFYDWLKLIGVFTFEEVREVWQMFTVQERTYFMSHFSKRIRIIIMQYFNRDDSPAIDDLKTLIFKPTCSTKCIYKTLVVKNYMKPIKVISKWERDLQVGVEDYWNFLCTRYSLIYATNLRVFHILFLHQAFCLNPVLAKFIPNISELCSFCHNEVETYIHLFWECPVSKALWSIVIEFCEEYICTVNDVLNCENCMLNNFKNPLLALIITSFKRYLHLSRIFSEPPTIETFFARLKVVRNTYFKKCKYIKKVPAYYQMLGAIDDDSVFSSWIR